jgi:ribosomal protein S18 acetylase RimI-like enzyme
MLAIRALADSERQTLRQFWMTHWGSDFMVIRGQMIRSDHLEAFVAVDDGEWIGLVTFCFEPPFCEIVSLDSLRPGSGIGTALLKMAGQRAREADCHTLRLITTNDNTHALRFYQKLGFELSALYCHAMDLSRKLKPSIPETGQDGIPIRDEIELQLHLSSSTP